MTFRDHGNSGTKAPIEWNRIGESHGPDSRQGVCAIDEIAIKVVGLCRRVPRERGIQSHHQMVRTKPRIERECLAKPGLQHTGRDEQHHGQGYLRDHKHVAADEPFLCLSQCRAFQGRRQLNFQALPCWGKAKKHGAEDGRDQTKRETR